MNPGQTNWQVNSEYEPVNDMTVSIERRSAIIYLVLDSSTSLNNVNVNSIRTAAKDFIDLVAPGSGEEQTYTVTVANTITGGTVSATPTSGANGTTVYLSNTPASGYSFGGYTVNGMFINGSSFTLAGNTMVSAVFNPLPSHCQQVSKWDDSLQSTV